MQRMEHIFWRGIVTVITAAVMFALLYRCAHAEEITGEEVYFTHAHTVGCKTIERADCANNHAFYYHTSDSGTFHCHTCDAQTNHISQADVYRCVETGSTWQENAYYKCSVCGALKSTWGGSPGLHYYDREKLGCGISEGERTSSVKIVADGAWSNQGVTLTAKQTALKNDGAGGVTFSWDGGSFFAAENGTYTVTARNGAGASVTASIVISCIDKKQPVILSVFGDTQGMTASGISISVTAADEESGLADAPYSFDGGATWTAGSTCWVEEGREILLRVRDKAGNISEKTVKRGDFPYPPPASVPTPAPAPSPAPAWQPSSDTNADSGNRNGQEQITGAQEEQSGLAAVEEAANAKTANTGTSGNAEGKSTGNGKPANKSEGAGKTGGKNADSKKAEGSTAGAGNGEAGSRRGSLQAKPRPAILKEGLGEDGSLSGFRVVRMDKAQAAGTKKTGDGTMADYMQAVVLGSSDRYALKSSVQEADSKRSAPGQIVSGIKEHAGLAAGILLLCAGLIWCCRTVWLYTAELYCYDVGNTYRRLGILPIKKRKKQLKLYLPDDMLTKTGAPRYRLVVKNGLIKRFGKMDLVVYSDAYSLRRPLEECVDFVL